MLVDVFRTMRTTSTSTGWRGATARWTSRASTCTCSPVRIFGLPGRGMEIGKEGLEGRIHQGQYGYVFNVAKLCPLLTGFGWFSSKATRFHGFTWVSTPPPNNPLGFGPEGFFGEFCPDGNCLEHGSMHFLCDYVFVSSPVLCGDGFLLGFRVRKQTLLYSLDCYRVEILLIRYILNLIE